MDKMPWLETAVGLLAILSAILGWFARELWSAVKTLKDDLVTLKDEVHLHYVRKDDFRDWKDEIRSFLQRIETKLDTKVDKDR